MPLYLVTGATGFIGSRLVRQLVEEGHQVRALVRDPWRAESLSVLGVDLRRGDVTDKDSIREPMDAVDGVFHVAGWYRVGGRDTTSAERINVGGTRNVLEVMRELAVPKGVYTSTVAVFGDTHGRIVDESFHQVLRTAEAGGPWSSEYDRTKWVAHYEVAEPMVREGLPLVIVQPGGVYGVGDTSPLGQMIRQYLRRQLPVVPRDAAICWGHVEDTARAHLLAMARGQPGQSYVIAGEPHTYAGAFRIAERITGIRAPRAEVPSRLLRRLARVAAVVERAVPLPAQYSSEYLRAAAATYLASNAKARQELGFAPRSLEDGFREVLPAELANLGLPRPAPA
jgi:nucleoside-diphosphate-sugar epimerase